MTRKTKIKEADLKKLGFRISNDFVWTAELNHSQHGTTYDIGLQSGLIRVPLIDKEATVADLLIAVHEAGRAQGEEDVQRKMRHVIGVSKPGE